MPRTLDVLRYRDRTVLLAAALLTTAGAGLWYTQGNDFTPNVTLQVPEGPPRNAFDYLLAASAAIDPSEPIDPKADLTSVSAREIARKTVAKQARVDGYVRLALLYPYYNRPIVPPTLNIPYTSRFVGAVQVLALEARLSGLARDHAGLVDHAMSGIEIGEWMTHGATLWNVPMQAEAEDACRFALWDNINTLSPDDCRAILSRYAKIESVQTSLVDVLKQDKWFGQMQMALAFKQPDWQQRLYSLSPTNGDDDKSGAPSEGNEWVDEWFGDLSGHKFPPPTAADSFHLRFLTKAQVYEDFTRQLDLEIAAAQAPSRPWPRKLPGDFISDRLTFDGAPLAQKIDSGNKAENQRLIAAIRARLDAAVARVH